MPPTQINILIHTPLKRQKSPTLAWDEEKQVIRTNGAREPISQTKMIGEGNSVCFSGLNDLRAIPALTEIPR